MSQSTQHQAVSLKMRPDLIADAQLRRGQRYWVLKDPVSLRYHQLRDEEYTILSMLNGETTLANLRDRFEQKFAPRRLSLPNLQALLGMLYRQGLILSEASGQGEQLEERFSRQRSQKILAALGNILAIRFRGVDPERLLTTCYPLVRWCFLPGAAVAAILLCGGALLLLGLHFDQFQSRLPSYQSYFTSQNLVLFAVAIAITKVLHELGHAFACKHFGGECHEIGLMLLVFTPCLYCNVSDAWLIPDKWRRIVVSAAGIIVEVVLASIATLLWWWSEPGLFNSFCLNIMLVCSVGTVVFNANPLLRYDGYFMLADWIDMPNLWQRSRATVGGFFARLFLGRRYADRVAVLEDRPLLLFAYGMASIAYMWCVLAAILWFLWGVLEPLGLQLLVHCMIAVVFIRMLVIPLVHMARMTSHSANRQQVNRQTFVLRGAIVLALAAAVLFTPLPKRVVAPMVIEVEDADRVYITVPGRLQEAVAVGTRVAANEELARLAHAEATLEVETLAGELRSKQARLEHLIVLRAASPEIANEIPAAREAVEDVATRLRARRNELGKLILRAPRAGTVLAPPEHIPEYEARSLRTWEGHPLAEHNIGCFLETGTLCCLIGDPQSHAASLFVHQHDIESVQEGQAVRIRFDGHAGSILHGQVRALSKIDSEAIPPQLADHMATVTGGSSSDSRNAAETWYQAHVALAADQQPLVTGMHGQAKIIVAPTSLGWRLYRYLRSTFTFRV